MKTLNFDFVNAQIETFLSQPLTKVTLIVKFTTGMSAVNRPIMQCVIIDQPEL